MRAFQGDVILESKKDMERDIELVAEEELEEEEFMCFGSWIFSDESFHGRS